MKNVELGVEGVSCGLCVKTIEGTLSGIGTTRKLDLEQASVTVEFDENFTRTNYTSHYLGVPNLMRRMEPEVIFQVFCVPR